MIKGEMTLERGYAIQKMTRNSYVSDLSQIFSVQPYGYQKAFIAGWVVRVFRSSEFWKSCTRSRKRIREKELRQMTVALRPRIKTILENHNIRRTSRGNFQLI